MGLFEFLETLSPLIQKASSLPHHSIEIEWWGREGLLTLLKSGSIMVIEIVWELGFRVVQVSMGVKISGGKTLDCIVGGGWVVGAPPSVWGWQLDVKKPKLVQETLAFTLIYQDPITENLHRYMKEVFTAVIALFVPKVIVFLLICSLVFHPSWFSFY